MQYSLKCLAAASTFFLLSCGGSGSDGERTEVVTFDEFVGQVKEAAGEDAQECGIVEIDESELSANTCVASSFTNGQSFFAVYRLQGVDSTVAAALTGDSEGKVVAWRYDSNPSGGVPASSSEVEQEQCANASLTGSLDSGFADVFACD